MLWICFWICSSHRNTVLQFCLVCLQREDGVFHQTAGQHTSSTSWRCMRLRHTWSFGFLSSWSTKFCLLQEAWPADEDASFFRSIFSCFFFTNMNSVTDNSPTGQFSSSFFIKLYSNPLIFSCMSYFCLCLQKAEDGNKSQFGHIHCTVTYFIVLFLEGNKMLPAS